ncbi:MAG: DUF1667 domain-containing protein [Clostridiales bacterium]|nr:DUF1667 domain-containing protein [Clostridiales bacterium]
MEHVFTCTVCPFGCELHVTSDGSGKLTVTGNACPRGARYGTAEVTNPVRTLTSTVRIDGVSELHPNLALLPVKTDKPIPKAKLMEGMKLIKTLSVRPPMAGGTVIFKDFIEPGVNLVSGRDI